MTQPDSEILTLDLIGANQRLRDTLVMVLRGPGKGVCRLSEGEDAAALVVNLDGVGAQEEWARYRERFPARPVIALTLGDEPVMQADAVVTKPVRIEAFMAAVAVVRARLAERARAAQPAARATPAHAATAEAERTRPLTAASPAVQTALASAPPSPPQVPRVQWPEDAAMRALCGEAPDIDLEDQAQVEAARFSADHHLPSWVHAALEESRRAATVMDLVLGGRVLMSVDAATRRARTHVGDDHVQPLCARPWPALRLLPCVARQGDVVQPLEGLLWKLAVWTYRGRLPSDAPVRDRVYLRHWPNLTRLLAVPDAPRIAALLAQQPMQLGRVAEALRIPQRHVFAFYAAAAAIGLAGVARRQADHLLAQQAPPPDGRRDLLDRVARRLGDVPGEGAP